MHKADFSPRRRATALSWLRGELIGQPLSEEAQVTAAVGLLICDDSGHVKQDDLETAMADPSVLQAARALLQEARS